VNILYVRAESDETKTTVAGGIETKSAVEGGHLSSTTATSWQDITPTKAFSEPEDGTLTSRPLIS